MTANRERYNQDDYVTVPRAALAELVLLRLTLHEIERGAELSIKHGEGRYSDNALDAYALDAYARGQRDQALGTIEIIKNCRRTAGL